MRPPYALMAIDLALNGNRRTFRKIGKKTNKTSVTRTGASKEAGPRHAAVPARLLAKPSRHTISNSVATIDKPLRPGESLLSAYPAMKHTSGIGDQFD